MRLNVKTNVWSVVSIICSLSSICRTRCLSHVFPQVHGFKPDVERTAIIHYAAFVKYQEASHPHILTNILLRQTNSNLLSSRGVLLRHLQIRELHPEEQEDCVETSYHTRNRYAYYEPLTNYRMGITRRIYLRYFSVFHKHLRMMSPRAIYQVICTLRERPDKV